MEKNHLAITQRPRIGVVVLNWNKKEDVLRCLAAAENQTVKPVRVLLVDNASSDGSADAVRQAFPNVEILAHSENLGGSAGFNSGIRELLRDPSIDFIHLLDNDAMLEERALEALAGAMLANNEIAVAGSKILVTNSECRLQELGSNIDWERFHLNPVGQGRFDGPAFGDDQLVDYVPACSALYRVEALHDIGLMDEGNFLYWDDIEWGWRFNQVGWKVVAAAGSRAWHKMGAAARPSPLTTYYFWRNRFYFFNRNAPMPVWPRFIVTFVSEWLNAQAGSLLHGKRSISVALALALLHGLFNRRGACPRSGWPLDNPTDERLRKTLRDAGKIVLWTSGSEETTAPVVERLRRSFPDLDISRVCFSQEDPGGKLEQSQLNMDDWAVVPVNHVLNSRPPPHLSRKKPLILADRHSNLLSWDWRGKRIRLLHRLSRMILLPALLVIVIPTGLVARLDSRRRP